jgi:hypothetical protein
MVCHHRTPKAGYLDAMIISDVDQTEYHEVGIEAGQGYLAGENRTGKETTPISIFGQHSMVKSGRQKVSVVGA